MQNLPPVYEGIEPQFSQISPAEGYDHLIDTKEENEIAFNLAKLKEDLKMQAEAIQDLRKQAWENTGTTYLSATGKTSEEMLGPKKTQDHISTFYT